MLPVQLDVAALDLFALLFENHRHALEILAAHQLHAQVNAFVGQEIYFPDDFGELREAGFKILASLATGFRKKDQFWRCPLAILLRHHASLGTKRLATLSSAGEGRPGRFSRGERLLSHLVADAPIKSVGLAGEDDATLAERQPDSPEFGMAVMCHDAPPLYVG